MNPLLVTELYLALPEVVLGDPEGSSTPLKVTVFAAGPVVVEICALVDISPGELTDMAPIEGAEVVEPVE